MAQGVGVLASASAMILGVALTMPAQAGVMSARADRPSSWSFIESTASTNPVLAERVGVSRILPDAPAPMTGPTWSPALFEAAMVAPERTDPQPGDDTHMLWLQQDITVAALLTRRGKTEVPDLEPSNRSASGGILDVLFVIPSPGTIALAAFSALMSGRRRR